MIRRKTDDAQQPDGLASAVSDQPPAPTWRDAQGAPARVLAAVWWTGVAVAAYVQAWRQGARQHAASVALGIVVSACVFAAVLSRASASDGPALIPDAAVAATAAAEYATRQTEPPPGEATAMPAPQTGDAPADLLPAVARWWPQIVAAADKHGVPARLFACLVQQESGGQPTIASPAGAVGLSQIMPATGEGLGLSRADLLDPVRNLDGGARYLAQQFKTFGNWRTALAAYNSGPGGARRQPWYAETQTYVSVIAPCAGI